MKGNFNLKPYIFQLLFPHQPDAVLLIQNVSRWGRQRRT